jgi:H2-forming N5,N10-methylenetetrahydromethanopterin dehydrogenase-like enzyme
MSQQGGKKLVKRSGEREIVYNVYKFMKTESEVSITIPLSRVQERVAGATHVSTRTLCRVLKEGENVETGVTMALSTLCKLRQKVCTKSILDNFDEAVLRRIVRNFYLTEKQRPTLKAIHRKMCESTGYRGDVSYLRLVLRKMGIR